MSSDPRPVNGIPAVVLAAGGSRRFGSAKQLALLDGRTLLEHVLERAYEAGLRPIVAVVPIWLSRPASAGEALVWVRNPDPARGISHSLRLGLAAVPPGADAAVVLLGDQPTIALATIEAVVAARGQRPIVAAFAEGHPAPPVLLERSAFPLVDGLAGDVGLRELMAAHPELLQTVELGAHAPDVDRQADLDALRDG